MEKSSGQEINVVISDTSLYPMLLYPKFTVLIFPETDAVSAQSEKAKKKEHSCAMPIGDQIKRKYKNF